ncbi:uncharacterized protein LOC142345851 [Convolutriloba macropyga]|uniref:uncharacterized protein LOC142345851 n=1 Tax=Convolutriloba macropyga TaxID=536237 RepID=UPI003F51EBC7
MDSLSRTAAYQSWPKTMDFLRDLNKENPDRVLDYRLLHSIFTGTYWNLQNLWMGSEAKGTIHDEFWYFDVKLLTQKLQKQGYTAGYISDLCFHYPWRDKDNTDKRNVRLKKFKKHLDASELNTTGISLASCEILDKAIGSFSSFTPADVCFNGDYQFIQQLDNLYNIQTNWIRHGYPFFMSTESNMNHNMGGTNVKHIDSHLEQYLRKVAKQPDVITILVSDHGNRFDIYYMQKYFPEGQTDVMHPSLFIILPENPLRFYTQSELTALKINQNRLVTMRDVHYLLAKYTTSSPDYEIISGEKGLLSPISKERRCDSLTFTKGNFFCICEPLANDSFPLRGHEVDEVIRFTRYHLNGKISQAPVCKKMDLVRWEDKPFRIYPNRTASEPLLITGYVYTTHREKSIIFAVEVAKDLSTNMYTFSSFLRLDTYSKYRKCTPPGVDPTLCICESYNAKPQKIT